jgi:4,5-DOPA dioxygenase extradiol
MRLPVLFLAHGSPMNAIEDNSFTRMLSDLGASLPWPKAVLCVSAHWLTRGTAVTGMAKPRTIHDFGGFPEALYAVRYPAPGSPELAARVKDLLGPATAIDTEEWGFDHGAWSVLRHLYPKADVPVVQLGIDDAAPAERRFALGEALRPLRDEGVLIASSGNVVHNLRRLVWGDEAAAFDWAVAFSNHVRERVLARDFDALLADPASVPGGRESVPTPDHYDPLLYALGAASPDETPTVLFDGIQNGSLSMLSLGFGLV